MFHYTQSNHKKSKNKEEFENELEYGDGLIDGDDSNSDCGLKTKNDVVEQYINLDIHGKKADDESSFDDEEKLTAQPKFVQEK